MSAVESFLCQCLSDPIFESASETDPTLNMMNMYTSSVIIDRGQDEDNASKALLLSAPFMAVAGQKLSSVSGPGFITAWHVRHH